MALPYYVEDLASFCHPNSLQRARALVDKESNFMTRAVIDERGVTTLSAFVASSQGWKKRYKSVVHIDDRQGVIIDYQCSCPAFISYDGICKHCAALAMDYALRPEKYQGARSSQGPRTSKLIAELMERAPTEGGAGPVGAIELLPTLRRDYYAGWGLRLRIASPDASYVVRDIGKLVENVREGAKVTYGKKLTLTHRREVFTRRSQALLGLLEEVVERGFRGYGAWYRYGGAGKRDLDLDDRDLIGFLDLMEGESFPLEGDGTLLRLSQTVQVSAEEPPLAARLVPDRDGYLLVRDTEAQVVASGRRAYVLVDGTFHRCSEKTAPQVAALRLLWEDAEGSPLVVEEDLPRFCATLLPALEKVATVKVPARLRALRPVPGKMEFYFDKVDDAIEGAVQVRYGPRVCPLAGVVAPQPSGSGSSGPDDERPAGKAVGTPEPTGEEGEGWVGIAPAGSAFSLEDPAAAPVPLRDTALERRAVRLLHEYLPGDLVLPLDCEDQVGDLLFGGLARLRQEGEVFTTPAFDRLLADRKPRLSLGIALAGDLLAMDVTAEDLPPDELAALLAGYRRKRRFHRLRSGAFLDVADLDLRQLDVLMDDLGVTAEEVASGHFELPTYSAFFLDREFADARRNADFTAYVERFDAVDQGRYEVPETLKDVLRPYQAEGFRWLSTLMDLGLSGILADEMGLGKSVQLISLLLARRDQGREVGPSLVVCPASLVYNWLAEFERFAPQLSVRAVAGSKAERQRLRARAFDGPAEGAEPIDVLVTSYDLLRIDSEDYEGRTLFCCVLDEAQYIKNHATLTARAVKRLEARHRLALTGTPMENRLAELWSAFDFLMPGFLGSYARFRERYELGIVGGDEELSRRLQSLVGPFILRRLKADVLTELPEKLESVVRVSLQGEQRKLYAASEQRLREELSRQKKESASRSKGKGSAAKGPATSGAKATTGGKGRGSAKGATPLVAGAAGSSGPRVEVLAELTRLRQIALDPGLVFEDYKGDAAKMDAIMELVGQAMESGQKMLVFSQFTTFLKEISDRLGAEGVAHYAITGATPKRRRLDLVNAFNGDDTSVFLVSLKAGGTGLNLTGASVVVHADPWWNAAAQNQATDRAHRIGQKSVVSVYKVIAADTIEERILELQRKKLDLADAVIGAAGAEALSALTRDQLLELLE